jgi:hypothetical protein
MWTGELSCDVPQAAVVTLTAGLEEVYSVEDTDIPKAFFTPHHVHPIVSLMFTYVTIVQQCSNNWTCCPTVPKNATDRTDHKVF